MTNYNTKTLLGNRICPGVPIFLGRHITYKCCVGHTNQQRAVDEAHYRNRHTVRGYLHQTEAETEQTRLENRQHVRRDELTQLL